MRIEGACKGRGLPEIPRGLGRVDQPGEQLVERQREESQPLARVGSVVPTAGGPLLRALPCGREEVGPVRQELRDPPVVGEAALLGEVVQVLHGRIMDGAGFGSKGRTYLNCVPDGTSAPSGTTARAPM